jgi:DNA-binding CsgD family transcriptional regulator/tetratricopeptide (TPR) repeat protein
LVGREAEFEHLRNALDAATSGQLVAVMVGGEAGVGKTRLISEFASEARHGGVRVIVGQCVALGGDGMPFVPIAGALRDLAAQVGTDAFLGMAGPGRSVLPSLLPELGAEPTAFGDGRGRLFEAVAALVENAVAEQPLMLVVEDMHWADGSTRDLLRFVLRAVDSAQLMLVTTYRSDEIHRRHPLRPFLAELDRVPWVQRLDVPRFSHDEVDEQLRALLDREPSPELVEQTYRRSGGIPFFVEELAGSVGYDSTQPPLPDSLRDLLLVRAEQLPAHAQDVLRVLAVGGNQVADALLREVSTMEAIALEEALREAVSSNVIRVEGETYVFRHALLREALHDDLLPGTHVRLHSRYAEVLEDKPELASGRAWLEIAHHWGAAHEQERAFAAYLKAADDAMSGYAYAEGQRKLEHALELWHRMPDPVAISGGDRIDLLMRAAKAAELAGELERSLTLANEALAEPGIKDDLDRYAKLLDRRSKQLSDLEHADALAEIKSALAEIPAEPPTAARARLVAMLGARNMMDGKFTEAVAAAEEAIAIAEEVDVVPTLLRGLTILAPSLVATGQFDLGFEAIERANRLVEAHPNTRLEVTRTINLSDTYQLLGRYNDAVKTAIDGMDKARDVGLARSLGAMLTGNAVEPMIALGQWTDVDTLITRTLDLDPPARHRWHLQSLHAWLLLWQGDIKGAEVVLGEVRASQVGRSLGFQYRMPVARISAEIALAVDDPVRAWEYLAGELTTKWEHPGYALPTLAVGASVIGAKRRAGLAVRDDDIAELRAGAERAKEWPTAPVWLAVVDAELTDDADAWNAVIVAVDAAEGPAHLRPYARYRQAQALVNAGDRGAAMEVLPTARDEASGLGAGLIVSWVDDLARRVGLKLDGVAPGGRSAGGDAYGLTEREREVLRLVAAGRSNREIGAELFISVKTASVHVSNILAKLDVSGRGEAAAIAHRDNLA